jgi:hypothetical protein
MSMISAKSICEEFCDEVKCLYKFNIVEGSSPVSPEAEIRCRLTPKYLTPLIERLAAVNYCCTQVQKDISQHKCIAWFEPRSLDS